MNTDEQLWHFKDIYFDEQSHSYVDSVGTKYTSATSWIKQFEPHTDWDAKAAISAARQGMTTQALKQQWKYNGDYACALGTQIHAVMEKLWQHKKYTGQGMQIFPGMQQEFEARKQICWQAYAALRDRYVPVREELIVYNTAWGICGTIDFLAYDPASQNYAILDWKTNKSIDVTAYPGSTEAKLLGPFSALDNCKLNIYSLQLSLYKALIESMTQLKIGSLSLVHLAASGWTMYPCQDLSAELLGVINNGHR